MIELTTQGLWIEVQPSDLGDDLRRQDAQIS